MPSYTTSLRLIQPSTGEYPGTWGSQVNTGLTALVDTSVAGTATITMTAADYTLSTANGATDEARAMVLNLTGTPGAARNVICPAVSKLYVVYNNTTGGFAQTVKTSAGTGISVPNGKTAFLRCDGTNVVEAVNYAATLSLAGTANGVMYLNASNVVTTGSGLVFDGSNLGIGTNSPGAKLETVASGTAVYFSGGDSAVARRLQFAASTTTNTGDTQNINALGSTGVLAFQTNSTERMRLDASGNLGLGVTPSASWSKRAIQFGPIGSVASDAGTTNFSSNVVFGSSSNTYITTGHASGYYQNSGQHVWITAPSGTAGNAITFTQAMTLDASGNLGLGVTPRTTTGAYKAFEFGQSGYLAGVASGTGVALASNAYLAAGATWTYSTTDVASYYEQSVGAHRFYTAPSGTAGNAISFGDAKMTLDASGNLGVGTTTPGARLDVADGTTAGQITSWFTKGNSDPAFRLGFSNGSGSAVNTEQAALVFAYTGVDVLAKIGFLRGSTSDSNGITFSVGGTGGGTERARITSNGDWLVGRTSLTNPLTTDGVIWYKNNSGGGGTLYSTNGGTGTALALGTQGDALIASFYRSGTVVGSISVTTTATAYNTSSDYRLKDNPQPLTNSGAFIDSLKPKTWQWKANGSRGVGFLAHEAQEVSPSSVTGAKDAVDEDGNPVMQAMEYGSAEFIANIVAEIQSLRARVAALEAA